MRRATNGAHLVQLLLLQGSDGAKFAPALYRDVARELTERFGGVSAYSRAPAKGLCKDELVARALPMARL